MLHSKIKQKQTTNYIAFVGTVSNFFKRQQENSLFCYKTCSLIQIEIIFGILKCPEISRFQNNVC